MITKQNNTLNNHREEWIDYLCGFGCNLRRRAVVDALANGRFALKAAATVKQLCFWINQHGIVLRNPLGYRV